MTACQRCEDGLLAYLYHELEGDERTAFEQHLSESPGCRTELESLRATVQAASADDALEPPEHLLASLRARARLRTVDDPAARGVHTEAPPARFRTPTWAAAAAVVITVGALAWRGFAPNGDVAPAANGDVAMAPSDSIAEKAEAEAPAPAAPRPATVTESKTKRRNIVDQDQFADRGEEFETAPAMESAALGMAMKAPPNDLVAALRAGDTEVAWAHYENRYQLPSRAAKSVASVTSKRSRAVATPVDHDLLASLAPLQAGDERTRAALLVFLQRLGQESDQETATQALQMAVDLGIGLAQWQDAQEAAVALERLDPTSGQEAQRHLREAQSSQER